MELADEIAGGPAHSQWLEINSLCFVVERPPPAEWPVPVSKPASQPNGAKEAAKEAAKESGKEAGKGTLPRARGEKREPITELLLVLTPAVERLDTRWLSNALGVPRRSLRLARREECVDLFGAWPGVVPPLPLREGVTVLGHASLRATDALAGTEDSTEDSGEDRSNSDVGDGDSGSGSRGGRASDGGSRDGGDGVGGGGNDVGGVGTVPFSANARFVGGILWPTRALWASSGHPDFLLLIEDPDISLPLLSSCAMLRGKTFQKAATVQLSKESSEQGSWAPLLPYAMIPRIPSAEAAAEPVERPPESRWREQRLEANAEAGQRRSSKKGQPTWKRLHVPVGEKQRSKVQAGWAFKAASADATAAAIAAVAALGSGAPGAAAAAAAATALGGGASSGAATNVSDTLLFDWLPDPQLGALSLDELILGSRAHYAKASAFKNSEFSAGPQFNTVGSPGNVGNPGGVGIPSGSPGESGSTNKSRSSGNVGSPGGTAPRSTRQAAVFEFNSDAAEFENSVARRRFVVTVDCALSKVFFFFLGDT
ncbi:hypothetical protein T492DRAFT_290959 [Pavlovales sp. CCMP2436]|nr:hypothetical protein T492DRAFT_290959 [Pavlovales sp. CCMP2436]